MVKKPLACTYIWRMFKMANVKTVPSCAVHGSPHAAVVVSDDDVGFDPHWSFKSWPHTIKKKFRFIMSVSM